MKTTKTLTKISIFSLLLALNACSGSHDPSTDGANISPTDVIEQPEVTKRVVIGQISIIPTNIGINGRSVIRVDNHTDTNLYLKSYGVGLEKSNNILARSYETLKRAVGAGSGPDVSTTCDKLIADNHCEAFFTPDQQDGSVVLSMEFEDKEGKVYHAAQLIEYSSHAPQHNNGFYVSNDHISTVVTDSSYSLSIPYVSDGEYKSIKLGSAIGALSQSNTCEDGATEATLCTALLTLPAPKPEGNASYQNQISITGERPDGSVTRSFLTSTVVYNKTGHLVMTLGPAIIDARKSQSKVTINLVNNGVARVDNIIPSSSFGDRFFNGVTTPAKDQTTADMQKNYECGTASALNATLDPGKSCSVTFTLTNPDATGSEEYKISYTGGVGGTAPDTISTRVYYHQKAIPTYGYSLSGDIALTNVAAKQVLSQSIILTNIGEKELRTGLNSHSIQPHIDGLSVNGNTSTCLRTEPLAPNGTCTYVFDYKPPVATTGVVVSKFSVTAKNTETVPTNILPAQAAAIRASAKTGAGSVALDMSGAENNNFSIFADKKAYVIREIVIKNPGAESFILEGITASNWPNSLSMVESANAKVITESGVYTPKSGLVLAGGKSLHLAYKYGPVAKAESGYTEQTILGKFAGVPIAYQLKIVTNYRAESADTGITVKVESASATTMTNDSTPSFVLLKDNRMSVKFKYTAGSVDRPDFLVHDADLPFGFMVIKGTQTSCPTTSKGSRAGVLKASESCTVAYEYLAESLDHSLFYTAAVAKPPVSIRAPEYSFKNNAGINVMQSNAVATFNPQSFAKVTAKVNKIANTNPRKYMHPQKSGAPRGNLLSYHLIWTFKP
ncbi:MAG: hypothetical protein K2X04_07440, partial [Burkholderiales bacterium]|nr:hypothetical protein [Burkholderiales bacterium]